MIIQTQYRDWDLSLEAGCGSCKAPVECCDCLTCAECGEVLATEGAFEFARLCPAVVCCSTGCLLALGSHKILTNCIEVMAMPSGVPC